MTRKDYIALADAIYAARVETRTTLGSAYVLNVLAARVADVLAADNPRFDPERFHARNGAGQVRDPIAS